VGITVFQLLMAIMAMLEFKNYASGIVMCIGCLLAWWAIKEDMNITYICWFGVVCVIGSILGVTFLALGFDPKISTIMIKSMVPFSCFCGLVLAWFLFADYEVQHPESSDYFAMWCRAFGLLGPKDPYGVAKYAAPASGTLLNKGQLAQFGGGSLDKTAAFGTGSLDNLKGNAGAKYGQAQAQAGGYFSMGKDKLAAAQGQAGAYGAQAGAYGAAAGAIGQDKYATAQANAQEGGFASSMWATKQAAQAPVQDTRGPGDLRKDPFLTQ